MFQWLPLFKGLHLFRTLECIRKEKTVVLLGKVQFRGPIISGECAVMVILTLALLAEFFLHMFRNILVVLLDHAAKRCSNNTLHTHDTVVTLVKYCPEINIKLNKLWYKSGNISSMAEKPIKVTSYFLSKSTKKS